MTATTENTTNSAGSTLSDLRLSVLADAMVLPAGQHSQAVRVVRGPRLLAAPGAGLDAHRTRWRAPGPLTVRHVVDLCAAVSVRGRGGAGFPFGTKLETAAKQKGRTSVVVNAAEGEPASAKDAALLQLSPHLVLDGAVAVARALGARKVHVVVPGERPAVEDAVRAAVAERADQPRRERDGVPIQVHRSESRFVAGQAQAVLQLISGRPNLPVTAWAPEAISGLGGRPTLLSNAETWAQVAALLALGAERYAELGTPSEPGTALATVAGDSPDATVLEVPFGTPLEDVLLATGHDPRAAVLFGGYHGRWLGPGGISGVGVSREDLAAAGATLGAGVVLPLRAGTCPVERTAAIASYLADETAGRCGPCRNGLPAMAQELRAVASLARGGDPAAVAHLTDRVSGRGACAHPDGTSRLVASLLDVFEPEVMAHERGLCLVATARGAGARDTDARDTDARDTDARQEVAR